MQIDEKMLGMAYDLYLKENGLTANATSMQKFCRLKPIELVVLISRIITQKGTEE